MCIRDSRNGISSGEARVQNNRNADRLSGPARGEVEDVAQDRAGGLHLCVEDALQQAGRESGAPRCDGAGASIGCTEVAAARRGLAPACLLAVVP